MQETMLSNFQQRGEVKSDFDFIFTTSWKAALFRKDTQNFFEVFFERYNLSNSDSKCWRATMEPPADLIEQIPRDSTQYIANQKAPKDYH